MIAVPFIYFTLLAIYLIRKSGGIDISVFLVMIYAFSALMSILLDICGVYGINGVYEKIAISPLATFAYCTLITLAVIPFRKIRSLDLRQIDMQKYWMVDLLSWVLIFTFFITLYNTFTHLDTIMQSDLKDVRDEVYENAEQVKLTGIQWLLALPETIFSQFSPVAILLYFANVANNRKSTLFNWLLLLSSLTPVVKAVLIAGRTQPIYWFLSFLALYIFFRPLMDRQQRRKALIPFAAFGGIVGLFIAAVTVSRFAMVGVANDTGAFDSLVAYSGQSFVNFNYFFTQYSARGIHLDRIFPLTNYFVWHPGWNLEDYRDLIWSDSGLNIGVFFTFLGDLLIDLGRFGMIVYVLIFSSISYFLCRSANNDGTITLSRLFVILILYLIPLQGIFYYSYYKVNIGFFIVGTLFVCWVLNHTIKRKYNP
ncbi:MAG: oligosaccharide repeat unit polymerase [Paludibacteraceae bacterium]|nr:oligosaccharide repeat unit polymerase [Paludibacteraceae bacterium]